MAAVVINPEEEADNVAELKAKGCAIYSSYEDMLRRHDGQVDLCLVPTGIHWHARMTLAALQAGASVLVEKPLAGSQADALTVQAAERASGRFVAVGFQDCYDPGTRWLADALQRGAIGEVKAVKFLGVWPRPRAYFLRNNWAGRLEVDGVTVRDSPLNNAFGHFVMLSLIFSGVLPAEIDWSQGEVELFRAHAIESFDTAVVSLRSRRGVGLWFGASHVSHQALEPEIMIEGTAGRAGWRYENEAWLEPVAAARERRAVLDQHATRQLMMTAVLRRLRDPAAAICSADLAARHTTLIEGIHGAAPIRAFPSGVVKWSEEAKAVDAIPSVPGLDAALRRAFTGQRSLRDCGLNLSSIGG